MKIKVYFLIICVFVYLNTYYIHIINILHSKYVLAKSKYQIYHIFLDGGYMSGGISHGGYCLAGICPGIFVLIPFIGIIGIIIIEISNRMEDV